MAPGGVDSALDLRRRIRDQRFWRLDSAVRIGNIRVAPNSWSGRVRERTDPWEAPEGRRANADRDREAYRSQPWVALEVPSGPSIGRSGPSPRRLRRSFGASGPRGRWWQWLRLLRAGGPSGLFTSSLRLPSRRPRRSGGSAPRRVGSGVRRRRPSARGGAWRALRRSGT